MTEFQIGNINRTLKNLWRTGEKHLAMQLGPNHSRLSFKQWLRHHVKYEKNLRDASIWAKDCEALLARKKAHKRNV